MKPIYVIWSNREVVVNAVKKTLGANILTMTTDSAESVQAFTTIHKVSGIIIDMVHQIQSSQEDRELVMKVSEIIPPIRVNWNFDKEELRSLFSGQSEFPIESLTDFKTYCENSFTPRMIRKSDRVPLYMNVYIEANDIQLRSCTLNVSETGLFILTDKPDLLPRELKLKIVELGDALIDAEVVREVSWGTSLTASGVGVQFDGIEKMYHNQLQKLISNA